MKITKKELYSIIDECVANAVKDFAMNEGLTLRSTSVKNAATSLNESFFQDKFQTLKAQLGKLFNNKDKKVKVSIQNAINYVKEAASKLQGEAQQDIQSIANILSSLAEPIINKQPQYESLQNLLSQKNVSKKELKKAIDNAINEASEYKPITDDVLKESINTLNEGIGQKFQNLFNSVKKTPGVADLLLKAKQCLESILNMLQGQAKEDMNNIVLVLGAAAGQFNQQQAPQQQAPQQ